MSDHDSIKALLEKPSEQWTIDELKAGFISALHQLNAANGCIDEYEQLSGVQKKTILQLRENNALLMASAIEALSMTQAPTTIRRKKKPRKSWTADDTKWLIDLFDEQSGGDNSLTDTEVFKRYFKKLGATQQTLRSPAFRTKLQSFIKNDLSLARKLHGISKKSQRFRK